MTPENPAGLREALDEVAALIELGETRALAVNGPVSHFRDELDNGEWRRLWVALSKVRAALDNDETALDEELGRAIDLLDAAIRERDARREAARQADAEVSRIHDFLYGRGGTMDEAHAACWRIHDLLRPLLGADQ